MGLLLVEPRSEDLYLFMEGLYRTTRCTVTHAATPEMGLGKLLRLQGNVDVAVITMDRDPELMLTFIQKIRSELQMRSIRVPTMVVLPKTEIPPAIAAKYRHLGIPCILRRVPDQVYAEITLALWMQHASDDKPTFRIRFCDGNYVVFLCGLVHSEGMKLSGQLRKLFMRLANGVSYEFTTEELADELGVCRQTIKKYMSELRARYDVANSKVNLAQTSEEVFWSKRGPGGTVHGLKARIVWEE